MSYSDDVMRGLTFALRDTEGLKNTIKELNENIVVIERLAIAIEKQNELIERQLSLNSQPRQMTLKKSSNFDK